MPNDKLKSVLDSLPDIKNVLADLPDEKTTGQYVSSGLNKGISAAFGAPVDIANMGFSAVGLGSEKPFGGHKTFEDLFRNMGFDLTEGEPTNIAERIPYVLGDMLIGAAPVNKIIRAGKAPLEDLPLLARTMVKKQAKPGKGLLAGLSKMLEDSRINKKIDAQISGIKDTPEAHALGRTIEDTTPYRKRLADLEEKTRAELSAIKNSNVSDEKKAEMYDEYIKKSKSSKQFLREAIESKEGVALSYNPKTKGFDISEFSPETKALMDKLTPVEAVQDKLRKAKRLNTKQNIIYRQGKASRAKGLEELESKYSGKELADKRREYLKERGAYEKVDFEPLKLTEKEQNGLYDAINKSARLKTWERIPAYEGLDRMLKGQVPRKNELEKLGRVFPKEMVDDLLDKRSALQKAYQTGLNVINLPRSIMSTADLSAPLRQGIFFVRRQKQFAPAFRDMFKYAGSEKAYKGLLDEIASRPTYDLMQRSKLAITDLTGDLTKREEAIMSNLAEKIPGFGGIARGSNRAYSGFLDKMRADVFDDLVTKATNKGLDVEAVVSFKGDKGMTLADHIAEMVNAGTGRGNFKLFGLEKNMEALNATFFSPRLIASRLQLVSKVFNPKTPSFVRKEMLKDWAGFLGTGTTVLGLAKMAGANVGVDPRSADFGKIKIGDTRYDIWGGFQQYAVLLSRLVSGKMISSTTGKEYNLGEGYKPTTRLDILGRSLEYKTSPLASFGIGAIRGETSTGKEFNFAPEILDRMMPIIAQDINDIVREEGWDSLYKLAPTPFGIGTQTYGKMYPVKTDSGIKFRGDRSLGEIMTGYGESNLTPFQEKKAIRNREKRIQKEQRRRK